MPLIVPINTSSKLSLVPHSNIASSSYKAIMTCRLVIASPLYSDESIWALSAAELALAVYSIHKHNDGPQLLWTSALSPLLLFVACCFLWYATLHRSSTLTDLHHKSKPAAKPVWGSWFKSLSSLKMLHCSFLFNYYLVICLRVWVQVHYT